MEDSSRDDTEDILYDRIEGADTAESLDLLSKQVESMALSDAAKNRVLRYLSTQKQLVVQTERSKGEYFVEAKRLYETRRSNIPDSKVLMRSFDNICRKTTPLYYERIKKASETKTGRGCLQDPWLATLGTNSQFEKRERDIFDNNIDPVKAHIFLDSKLCAPGWGHMAEGATGKIEGGFDEEGKNQVRLLRMMGGNADKENCLRYDVHNFLTLQSSHRVYFDGEPQMLIIPLFPTLEEIKGWDGETPYDVLILAASAATDDVARNGKTAAEIYQAILCQFDWKSFDDENNNKSGTCNPEEVRKAFSVLGQFVEAMAHSLLSEIPQDLIKRATKRDCVNNGEKINKKNNKKSKKKQNNKKPPASPMATLNEGEEIDEKSLNSETTTKSVWWQYQGLVDLITNEGGVRLPYLPKDTKNFGRVLKLRLNAEPGRPLPDPWGLMAKAGCNYSYIEYGYKILPACKPPLDESQLEYEVALQLHERRARQQEIPSSLIVPVAPHTPTANLGTNFARNVTPESETKESESGWEFFTD